MGKKRTRTACNTIPYNSYLRVDSRRAKAVAKQGEPLYICDANLNPNDPDNVTFIQQVELVNFAIAARKLRYDAKPVVVPVNGVEVPLTNLLTDEDPWRTAVQWARTKYQNKYGDHTAPVFYRLDLNRYSADMDDLIAVKKGTRRPPIQPSRMSITKPE